MQFSSVGSLYLRARSYLSYGYASHTVGKIEDSFKTYGQLTCHRCNIVLIQPLLISTTIQE